MPQDQSFRGPLAELTPVGSPDAVESYFYPSNLTTVTNHYMRFDAAIFQDSRFQQGISGGFSPPVNPGGALISGIVNNARDLVTAAAAVAGATPLLAIAPINRILADINLNNPGGTTTAALNYLNSLPEGGQFYNAFPGLRGIGNKKVKTHLYLYTPDTVTFDYQNKWESVSLRDQFTYLADGISWAAQTNMGAHAGAAASAGHGLATAFGMGRQFDIAAAMSGFPTNPMTEVLFKSTEPRTFQFNFKMYPQTPNEAEQIFKIVEQFSFHAAPEYANSEVGGFMIMPSVFDIKFMFLVRDQNGNAHEIENPWMRRISTCGLEAISVDYSPDEQFQAMEDGSPRALTLALKFHELEIMDKSRIARGF